MKAFLMHERGDFDFNRKPPRCQDLIQDLELETLFEAMAAGDRFLLDVARAAVLSGLDDVHSVLYRQNILRDCLDNPLIVHEIYDLVLGAIDKERKDYFGSFSNYPSSTLSRAIRILEMFVDVLKRLRQRADAHADKFRSEGFKRLFAMLQRELSDEYFEVVRAHLSRLQFRHGVLISAELGQGNKGVNYILRMPNPDHRNWFQQMFAKGPPAYTFHLHERDESGARAVAQLRDRGINIVANAAAQSNDHILGFFQMLRAELAFYIGCLNLHARLSAQGEPTCFPVPIAATERRHRVRGLYDVCLALKRNQRVVGNDLDGDGKQLFMITGANQGGKSSFLRSIGVAQLMMQCGMFVPARSYCANLAAGLFTHYKREEDAAMSAGKFEEELRRMSEIVDHLSPGAIVLFNESFQSTNEREGSEIARQIVRAFVERGIKVFFVTHMYDLARRLYDEPIGSSIFLRAERLEDGTRTFKIVPGAPLPTSYGKDLYAQIFRDAAEPGAVAELDLAAGGGS
jgi:DNA mismatch repair ATPase MutS